MANELSKPQPQQIPLAKIHDLPGAKIYKQPDKSYGGLVSSIQTSGVKEPVILRLREDGEYQLITGYRRRRASELAKKKEIPAYVYEMTMEDALQYHAKANTLKMDTMVPGKRIDPTLTEHPQNTDSAPTPGKEEKAPAVASKPAEQPPKTAVPAPGEKPKENKPAETDKDKGGEKPAAGTTPGKEEKAPAAASKPSEQPSKATAPTPGEKPKEEKPAETDKDKGGEKPAGDTTPGKEEKNPAAASKPAEQPPKATAPAPGVKPKEEKPVGTNKDRGGEKPAAGTTPGKEEKAPAAAPKPVEQPPKTTASAPAERPKEDKGPTTDPKAEKKASESTEDTPPWETPKAPVTKPEEKKAKTVTGPAAQGPAGTVITQIFDSRLNPPDEKAIKELPVPKEGESLFITLHPGYLHKSKFNTFSVDTDSENFKELLRSVELSGIKDPVLTRIDPEVGGLEILSGQRRHLAAGALNYPVPAIIQKIDDADAKIIVADGNLHRPKLTTYDLSRALRMKMEGMKQKAGRKKKGFTAAEMDSDEKLAKEMGMSVSKLNRILRLSEASKDVCDRVDDGKLTISTAASLSFLPPKKQDMVMHLMDLGYKAPTERIEYLKKVEKAGKLDEMAMRQVLDGKNILDPPKIVTPPPAAPTTSAAPTPTATAPASTTSQPSAPVPTEQPPIPPSPDVKPTQPTAGQSTTPSTSTGQKPAGDVHSFKGEQERPEHTKIILTGDRLRRYFPDVSMTPREIEESVYDALEERRVRQLKQQNPISKKTAPTR